jgi:hypothetical protein
MFIRQFSIGSIVLAVGALAVVSCDQPPEQDGDNVDESARAATTERFFNASDEALAEAGIGSYGIAGMKVRALPFEPGKTVGTIDAAISK